MKTTLVLAALLAAAPAAAQGEHHGEQHHEGHHPGGMEHHGMEHGGMMGMQGHGLAMHAGPGPMMLIHHAEELGIGADVVTDLTALMEETYAQVESLHESAMAAQTRAVEHLTGDNPDLEAYARALREAADHRIEAQVGMARAHVAAGRLLTPEQREAAHGMMERMGEQMRHHPSPGHQVPRHQGAAGAL